MKKILFAVAMFFAAALFINFDVHASTIVYTSRFSDSPYTYVFDDSAVYYFNNSEFGSGTGYHPVAFFENGLYWFMGKYSRATIGGSNQNLNTIYYNGNNGNTIGSRSANTTISQFISISFDGLPCFNNRSDASNYAKNLPYNPSNIIAGTVPYQNTFSSDRQYQPYINFADIYYGYEDFFGISIQGLSTTLDLQLRDPAQVPNYTNSRVQLVYYVPTSLSMDTFLADYDMGSGIFQASSIETFMKQHPDFRYTNNLTYESHAISKNVDFSETTRFIEEISNYSTWGNQDDLIYNQLLTIYGNNTQKALYAYLLLMRYDYVSVAHYSDNTSTKVRTVYPAGFYYFNLYNYDNSLYKKRGIPVSPSAGTGSLAPTYDNPQNPNNYTGIPDAINNALQDQLTNNINDSHNSSTIINNYYQGVDDRIDQFQDGTLNIDDTIGNVVSVAKSVSHIGLIFGYLFNGFLPVEVITLLGFAFVLIPIIVIIKLIRG